MTDRKRKTMLSLYITSHLAAGIFVYTVSKTLQSKSSVPQWGRIGTGRCKFILRPFNQAFQESKYILALFFLRVFLRLSTLIIWSVAIRTTRMANFRGRKKRLEAAKQSVCCGPFFPNQGKKISKEGLWVVMCKESIKIALKKSS